MAALSSDSKGIGRKSATPVVSISRASTEPVVRSPFFDLPSQPDLATTQTPTPMALEESRPVAASTTSKSGRKKEKGGKGGRKRKAAHLALDSDDNNGDPDDDTFDTTTPAKSSKSSAPAGWEFTLRAIENQRRSITAAVDRFGAEACSSRDDPAIDAKVSRYHTLIALMLSSQTKDEVTWAAMEKLKRHGLTVDNILSTSDADLDSMIAQVGFHNKKTVYIKKATKMLKDKYDGDVPATIAEIVDLPGVGPKMGHLLMLIAWNKATGIGVDTHVHRISNRLGWVRTETPEKTRIELERWLPEEYWTTINKTLVGFGQAICQPINPKCNECEASEYCPSAYKGGSKASAQKRRKTQ